MTTRHAGYLVVLDEDIREDDAEAIIIAIKMVKFVRSVQPVEGDCAQVIARSRRDDRWVSVLRLLASRGPDAFAAAVESLP